MVARRAHNPKVVGSNPAPATKYQTPRFNAEGVLFFLFPAASVFCRIFLPAAISERQAAVCLRLQIQAVWLQSSALCSRKPAMPTVRFTESVSKQDLDALFERAKASYGAESCWKTLYLNRLPLGNLSPEWAERIKKDWEAGCSESSDGIFLNADGWPDMGGRL